jgi:hypothetical protein
VLGHLNPDDLLGRIDCLIGHPLTFSSVGQALAEIVQFATSN